MVDRNAPSAVLAVIRRPWLPILVGLLLGILVALVWWSLDNQRHFSLHRMVNSGATEFSSNIEGDIRARIPALQRIVGRWEARGGTPKEEFILDSLAHIEDFPGFQALGWVDESFHVRWIVPLEGNEQAEGFYLAAEEKRRVALETARDNGKPAMTGLVDLVQGGKGLLLYFPIRVENKFGGFVAAVFRVNEWLDYVASLDRTSGHGTDFLATVEIEEQLVYEQSGWDPDNQLDWQAMSEIELLDHRISVTVQPTALFFERNASAVPEMVAAGGILFSILLAVLVYLYQHAALARAKLQRAQEKLEERVAERTAELGAANEELRLEVAERQRAEAGEEVLRKQLTHASRLGAVGDMATSLAHELNQPLTAIANYAAVCLRFLRNGKGETEDIIEDLERIKVQVGRAGDIIRWLRNAVSKGDNERAPLDINNCITEIGRLMSADFGEHGSGLVCDLGDDLPKITASKVQIQQVLVNLLQNSLKAHKSGTRKHQVTVRSSLSSEGVVRISVEDNGRGVLPDMQKDIFEPFVSTDKESLGFGLSISRSIIEAHGGLIWLDPSFEDGAAFRIELPANNQEPLA